MRIDSARIAARRIVDRITAIRRIAVRVIVFKITEAEKGGLRGVLKVMAETRISEPVREVRAVPVFMVVTIVSVTDALRKEEVRTSEIRKAEGRNTEDRTAVLKVVLKETEEAQTMANLPLTDKKTVKDLRDLALTAGKVNAVWAAVAKKVAVVSAVTVVMAAIAEAMVDREIDSEVGRQIKILWLKHRPKILRRSVKKKRDASVRKRTRETAKI